MRSISPIWKEFRLMDAHAHVGNYFDLGRKVSIETILEYMGKYGIERIVISCVTKDIRKDNDEVIKAVRRCPDKIIGLAHIDPTAEERAIEEIERCAKEGLTGLKLHPHYDAWNAYDMEIVSSVMKAAVMHRLPVLFHTGTPPMVTPIHVAYVAQHFPEIPLICGHMGGFDSTVECMAAFEMASNVYFDTVCTGAATEVERVIKKVGAERVMWGTDIPYSNFITEFFKLVSLDIPEEDKKLILFDNAAKIYGNK